MEESRGRPMIRKFVRAVENFLEGIQGESELRLEIDVESFEEKDLLNLAGVALQDCYQIIGNESIEKYGETLDRISAVIKLLDKHYDEEAWNRAEETYYGRKGIEK